LLVPDEAITCTWTATLALAIEAALRGVTILRNHRVEGVKIGSESTLVHTNAGVVTTRWVVNAAGLGADVLDREFGGSRFVVTPRRGQLMVFDKLARPLVRHIVLPVPTALGKGVLVSPTIYGNVMVGPTAEDLADRSATETTAEGLAFLLDKAARLVPALAHEEVTASYAGLRAASDHADFVVEVDGERRYAVAGGIRSTGLTAGMAIAEHLVGLLGESGMPWDARDDLPPPPRMPNLGEATLRPYQDAERIGADPAYGTVVCFCERVTEGEVRDALTSLVPPVDLDGLRRRTRAGNGRCQGFYCGARVEALLREALDGAP
jgi:glycerol-3-phosphate dehydrogenase